MDVVNAPKEVCSESDRIIFTTIPKYNHFQAESPRQPFVNSMEDCLTSLSSSVDEVTQFVDKLSEKDKAQIENFSRCQTTNDQCYRLESM